MTEQEKKPGIKRGANLGGVRTFEDLRQRSVVDPESGCWHVAGYRRPGAVEVWCAALGASVNLPTLIAVLKTGARAEKGSTWRPICGNFDCGNPQHRKLTPLGDVLRAAAKDRPRGVQFRMRIAKTMRAKEGSRYCPQARAEILASPESAPALAERYGLTASAIRKIRAGRLWRDAAPASSIFNLAGKIL